MAPRQPRTRSRLLRACLAASIASCVIRSHCQIVISSNYRRAIVIDVLRQSRQRKPCTRPHWAQRRPASVRTRTGGVQCVVPSSEVVAIPVLGVVWRRALARGGHGARSANRARPPGGGVAAVRIAHRRKITTAWSCSTSSRSIRHVRSSLRFQLACTLRAGGSKVAAARVLHSTAPAAAARGLQQRGMDAHATASAPSVVANSTGDHAVCVSQEAVAHADQGSVTTAPSARVNGSIAAASGAESGAHADGAAAPLQVTPQGAPHASQNADTAHTTSPAAIQGSHTFFAANGDALRSDVEAQTETADTPIKPEDFVVLDNLRFALPYFYDFKMHAKARMVGRHPVEVFTAEFPVRDRCVQSFPGHQFIIIEERG